jgi:hypothetical protein
MWRRVAVAVAFGMAFGYIESAGVVYLRAIFHAQGFDFPLEAFDVTPMGRRLLLMEVGREVATLVLIFTAAWLFGHTRRERIAWFMVIFAVWDVFYYVWLKVLLNWPASLLTWDILFLIPVIWAAPVLYPILVSLGLFAFAVAILYRSAQGRSLPATNADWLGWLASLVIMAASFCLGGTHVSQPDYAEYFYWPLFAAGYALGGLACLRCLRRAPASESIAHRFPSTAEGGASGSEG